MRVVALIGASRAGKTTTAEALIRELTRRGYRVAAAKSIGHADFSLDPKKHDTGRMHAAGALTVCARGKQETDFLVHERMEINRILAKMDADIVLLEGDTQADVPQILCAHTLDEVRARINDRTLVISGTVADRVDEVDGIPAMSALRNVSGLADRIEAVEGTAFPIAIREPMESHHERRFGTDLSEAGERKHRLILKPALPDGWQTDQNGSEAGFYLIPGPDADQPSEYRMHSIRPIPGFANDLPVLIDLSGNGQYVPITEALNTFGAAIIQEAQDAGLTPYFGGLTEELMQADAFARNVTNCLNRAGSAEVLCYGTVTEIFNRKDCKKSE